MKKTTTLLALLAITFSSVVNGQTITTCAGNGTIASDPAICPPDGGQATATTLNTPYFVQADYLGNCYTYAFGPYWDCYHIKKISPSGVITDAVGNGGNGIHSGDGGPATAAGISNYSGFCLDNSGNIYIVEQGSTPSGFSVSWIRKVNAAGIISTIAGGDTTGNVGDGGPAMTAWFDGSDIAVDAAGNILLTDNEGNRIRKINTSGIISTIAGTGTDGDSGDGGQATNAQLTFPNLITLDASGNIYFTDHGNAASPYTVIRKITPAGIISTMTDTSIIHLSGSSGLACDNSGNVYFCNQQNEVQRLSSSGSVTTVAGNAATIGYNGDGEPATAAALNNPAGLSIDGAGNLYIADQGNYRIRKVSPHTTGISTNSLQHDALRIWPDPNDGTFTIYVPSATNEAALMVISNMVGQKIKEITTATNQEANVKLDAPPGMYFITVIAGQEQQTTKVIVR